MEKALLNQAVPDFSAPITGGRTIRLSDYRGKNLILYFYPKDNTPGCTQEGQAFRDQYEAIQALGAVVLGVSRDSIKTHENFKAKQCFPFDLISDASEELCRLFDVIKLKSMYGKQVLGIERSTFLIDGNGILVCEWRKVKVPGHCADVIRALSELSVSEN